MTARIAFGRAAVPRFVKLPVTTTDIIARSLGLSAQSLNLVHRGMSDVVNWEGRTAWAFWIITDTQLMAGKTGSSQVFSKHHRAVTRQTLLLGFTLFCAGLPGIALGFLHDDAAAVANGRDLYLRNCAACHGANLEG